MKSLKTYIDKNNNPIIQENPQKHKLVQSLW